jgi:hypothetical protein
MGARGLLKNELARLTRDPRTETSGRLRPWRPFPPGIRQRRSAGGWRLERPQPQPPIPWAQLRRDEAGWVHTGDVRQTTAWLDPVLMRELRPGEMVQARRDRVEIVLRRGGRSRRRRLSEWLLQPPRPLPSDGPAALAAATWAPGSLRPEGLVAAALAEDGPACAVAVAGATTVAEAEVGLWALRGTAFWTEAFRRYMERSRAPVDLGRILAAGLRPGPDALAALDEGLERCPQLARSLIEALASFPSDAAEPRLLAIAGGHHRCLGGRALGDRIALEAAALDVLGRVGGGDALGVLRRLSERAGWWAPLASPAQRAIVSIEARHPRREPGEVSLVEVDAEGALSAADSTPLVP